MDKKSTHEFETNDVSIKITEFPYMPGDEIHLDINPSEIIDNISLFGNPKKEQTLYFNITDASIWIKGKDLYLHLKDALDGYYNTWDDHFNPKPLCAPEPNCDDCHSDIDCGGKIHHTSNQSTKETEE